MHLKASRLYQAVNQHEIIVMRNSKMMLELYKEDQNFIIDLPYNTHLTGIIKNIRHAIVSPECDEFILCKLTLRDAEELAGQLSFEANHNRKKSVADRACDIAEMVEAQLSP